MNIKTKRIFWISGVKHWNCLLVTFERFTGIKAIFPMVPSKFALIARHFFIKSWDGLKDCKIHDIKRWQRRVSYTGIMPPCQGGETGSIPVTRSREKINNNLFMEQSVMPAPVSQESVKIPRLPGTRMLLKEAWNDYTDHFWTYIGISAIPVILAYILLVFVAQSQLGFFVLLIPFALVAFIASIWAHVALIYAVTHTSEGAGIKESFQKTWNKFVSYFWIAIITGIITMGGFMLFVIPGIIFMIWFGFAAIIFISEGDRGFRALIKSREYIR